MKVKSVTVEIREGALSRRARVTAPSIKKVFGDETMVVITAGMAVFGTGHERH